MDSDEPDHMTMHSMFNDVARTLKMLVLKSHMYIFTVQVPYDMDELYVLEINRNDAFLTTNLVLCRILKMKTQTLTSL